MNINHAINEINHLILLRTIIFITIDYHRNRSAVTPVHLQTALLKYVGVKIDIYLYLAKYGYEVGR